jgi:hypothetical protein
LGASASASDVSRGTHWLRWDRDGGVGSGFNLIVSHKDTKAKRRDMLFSADRAELLRVFVSLCEVLIALRAVDFGSAFGYARLNHGQQHNI